LILSSGGLRNECSCADTQHLRQRQNHHGEIAGETNCGDCFLAQMSNPIKVGQQIERLHHHADGEKARHLQQVFGDGTLREIFHSRRAIVALLQCIHERASLWMQSPGD
jgi:hypothetical protein